MNIKTNIIRLVDRLFYPSLYGYFNRKSKSSHLDATLYFNQYEKYEEDGIHVWLESPEHIFEFSGLDTTQASNLIGKAPISFLVKNKEILHTENITDLLSMDDRFCSFHDLNYEECLEIWEQKKNKACICLSNKRDYSGQNLRHEIADLCKDRENIDVYFFEKTHINDLFEVYSKYRYVIVAENCNFSSYVSEKLFDVIKCFSYPVYYGGSVIDFNCSRFHCVKSAIEEVDNLVFNGIEFSDVWHNYSSLCKLRNVITLRSQVLGLADYFHKKVHKKSFIYHIFALALKNLKCLK